MFGKKKNQPEEAPAVVEEVKNPEFTRANKTLIGEGITMIGNFTGKDPIVINGTLKGNIVSDNNILVAKGGQLFGNGNANALKVEGYVEGNMNLKDLTKFSETGKMLGQLETSRLSTDEGSVFEGTLKLNRKSQKQEEAPAERPQAEAAVQAMAAETPNESDDSRDNMPKAKSIPL